MPAAIHAQRRRCDWDCGNEVPESALPYSHDVSMELPTESKR
jgi:hypothetical protein